MDEDSRQHNDVLIKAWESNSPGWRSHSPCASCVVLGKLFPHSEPFSWFLKEGYHQGVERITQDKRDL